ncbi:VOC family protein [Nocardioides mesophilus]|uniref:VOC family protein n=1 Tax=Nocardioides mesophilus TaxID=433659 RepID=A0A7G9REB4_9ACTN|nr:VOC family protein [Nocardioides mesophilus]QNN53939.1 VOC family protein [Nocardioides mesophilus]
MTTPITRPTGAPCWIELTSSDLDASIAFYRDLLGWEAERGSGEYGGYTTFSLGGRAVAGGMPVMVEDGPADLWSVYLLSPDAAATAAAALERGGQVHAGPHEVPARGTMLFLSDPSGAGIGAWQPGGFAGIEVADEPGAPVWFELHTRSYDRDVAFYRDVFGWELHVLADGPGFRYTTLGRESLSAAGIMDASSWAPEADLGWAVYFAVDDCDETCGQVAALGGSVVTEPETTTYGRMATITDSTGAVLRLMTPPAGG